MKVLKLFYFILIVSSMQISAQELSGIPGAFVDIGFGAKPVGMGGAYVGYSNDVHSIIWNSAGLTDLENYHTAFTYTDQLGLINYHYLAAAIPMAKDRGLGFALISSGDKALREWTLNSAYAQKMYGFSVGINLKLRYATFGNNKLQESDFIIFEPDEITQGMNNKVKGDAFGFGFDIGILYDLAEEVSVGLQLRDIYSPVFWNSDNENPVNKPKGSYSELLPFELVFGSAFFLLDNVIVTADYSPSLMEDANPKLMVGVEAKFIDLVYIRGGAQNYINSYDDEKYVAGIGLDIARITENMRVQIDYSYMIEEFADSQRFSLGLVF